MPEPQIDPVSAPGGHDDLYRTIFERYPTPVWISDYSSLARRLAGLRSEHGDGLEAFLAGHPELVGELFGSVRAVDVNEAARRLVKRDSGPTVDAMDIAAVVGGRDGRMISTGHGLPECLAGIARGETSGYFDLRDDEGEPPVWARIFWVFLPGDDAIPALVWSSVADLSDAAAAESAMRRAEDDARAAEARYRTLFDSAVEGIFHTMNDGRILEVNPAAAALLGYDSPDHMRTSLGSVTEVYVDPDQRGIVLARLAAEGSITGYEFEARRRDGSTMWLALSATALCDAEGAMSGLRGSLTSVDERRSLDRRLREVADHDFLTGLLTRRRFEAELVRHARRSGRRPTPAALLSIDLDGLKKINDGYGHAAGDEALRSIALLLRDRLRESDVLSRFGGDEFVALLVDTDVDEAREVATDLLERVRSRSIAVGDLELHVTVSIGIVPAGGADDGLPAELLADADAALYEAKESGRDRVVMLEGAANRAAVRAQDRKDWAYTLRGALDDDEFELHAQPVVQLSTGKTEFYEVLLRLRGADGALVPAAGFLGHAERLGLMEEIDHWVLTRVIDHLGDDGGRSGVRVSVNVGASSVGTPGLAEFIADRLAAGSVDPSRLVIELAETSAVLHLGQAHELAERLAGLGCGIALDDFGTGLGPLGYLRQIRLDYLKVDGEFVRNVGKTDADRAIVTAAVDIARGLGHRTVAESVEDAETVELLRELGMDLGQGAWLGPVRPLEEIWSAPASV